MFAAFHCIVLTFPPKSAHQYIPKNHPFQAIKKITTRLVVSWKCCIFAPKKPATSAASRHSSTELGSALDLHEVCQSNLYR